MKGELVSPMFCVERGIFDELAEADELLDKARAKVCALYDTPGIPLFSSNLWKKGRWQLLLPRNLRNMIGVLWPTPLWMRK
jgi:hypothetical protein